jgi:hypothetical protein
MPVITTPLKTFFSLNGQLIILTDYEGGIITGEIIKDKGPDQVERKHLGGISYEDFIFETRLNAQVKEVIRKSWEGDNAPLTCSLMDTDAALKATSETVFVDPSLTETIIPKCDGSSKDAAHFRLRIKPALIKIQKGDGKVIQPKITAEKAFLRSNFKFELGNLPCTRVATIDSFSVKKNENGKPQKNPTVAGKANYPLDIENLFLTISIADFSPWLEWHKTFVVDGKNSPSDELSGRLVFLGPNMRDELVAFKLQGVGIFSIERKMVAANQISRFNVGLYCNHIEMEP